MARLGHKKSRNGCQRCKARHVKCDEARPCSNCVKHHLENECSLVTGNPPVGVAVKRESTSRPPSDRTTIPEQSRRPLARTSSASLSINYVLNPSPTTAPPSTESSASSPNSQNDTYPFLTKFSHRAGTPHTAFTAQDLELMHHFTIATSQHMSSQQNVCTYWAEEGPKLAMPYPYLLHELLALSAMHKAYLDKDQRSMFYALGVYHQDLAIQELRKSLSKLNSDNVGAMFATGAILSISVFASTAPGFASPGLGATDAENGSSRTRSSIDSLVDIFALLHGMYGILHTEYRTIGGGPFKVLIQETDDDWVCPAQPLFFDIQEQIPSIAAFIEAQSLPMATRSEIMSTLETLRTNLQFVNRPRAHTREVRFLFHWPNLISSAFFNMMRNKEPAALVVLAYYAVVFAEAERYYWYMDGWGGRILRDIVETLGANSAWLPIIQWPWDCVNRILAKTEDGVSPPQQQPQEHLDIRKPSIT